MLCQLIINSSDLKITVNLEDSSYSLGRHPSNSIVIPSSKISRRHATLIKEQNRKGIDYSFYLIDGDTKGNRSSNGIFVNGEQVLEHKLEQGDVIHFADDIVAVYHVVEEESLNDLFAGDDEKENSSSGKRRKHQDSWESTLIGE